MQNFPWKAGALALAALLLVSAGGGLGAYLAAGHYQPILSQAGEDLGSCRAARGNLEGLAAEQGAKLGELVSLSEQRQARAVQAVEQARAESSSQYAAAQRLLQERTGGDQCQAAEAVIDQELGL
ncbi:hypothetical protein D3C78_386710 [compost metagenome]